MEDTQTDQQPETRRPFDRIVHKPSCGSLFSGIGAMDLGIQRAGFELKWQVEIDPYCRRVLERHWPDVRRHDDVRTWPQPSTERVDLVFGGFPCTDISHAGRREGIEGQQSGLWSEMRRIICELRPRFVLVENVAALLGRGASRVFGDLVADGFDCEWACIPAAAAGAPFIRDRVFVVATTRGLDTLPVLRELPLHDSRDARARLRVPAGGRVGNGPVFDWDDGDGAVSDSERREEFDVAGVATKSRRACGLAVAAGNQWRVEPRVGRVADGVANRVDRLRGLGNAVCPQVAEWIGRRVISVL